MPEPAAHRLYKRIVAAALVLALAPAPALLAAPTAKKQKPSAEIAEPHDRGGKRGSQAIVVLVNDEPITVYEIEQRAAFLAVSEGGNADLKPKAEARWKQIINDPKTNERFQEYLRGKMVRSQEQARALQQEYVKKLQADMIEQLKREARATAVAGSKVKAREELIEERIKVQEAKKNGIEVTDDDLKAIVKGIAERNKMTPEQFAVHVKGMGFDISTMKERFRAQQAWRELIRRKFAMQINVSERDIDRVVSAAAGASGEDTVELQLQKITLPSRASDDQTQLARRYVEAEALRRKMSGCKGLAAVAKEVGDARFEDLKFVKPSAIAEPTRSLLLSAKDGDILPPGAGAAGIEIYAVCGRRVTSGSSKQREAAQADLQQKEFELLARRHLLDLRQDAHIEVR